MATIEPNWHGMAPSSPVIWSTDLSGSVSWTASGGSPTSSSGSGFPWSSPGSAGVVRITATNGIETLTRDVVITSYTFSYKPNLPVEGSEDDTPLIHRLETGVRNGRQLVGIKKAYDLNFKNRALLEYNTAMTLYRTVGDLIPFTMQDPMSGDILAWLFDSGVTKSVGERGDSINYSFKVKQA